MKWIYMSCADTENYNTLRKVEANFMEILQQNSFKISGKIVNEKASVIAIFCIAQELKNCIIKGSRKFMKHYFKMLQITSSLLLCR
ncbi:MAG: hypothetical protein ACK56I_09420, partial [bacterium]